MQGGFCTSGNDLYFDLYEINDSGNVTYQLWYVSFENGTSEKVMDLGSDSDHYSLCDGANNELCFNHVSSDGISYCMYNPQSKTISDSFFVDSSVSGNSMIQDGYLFVLDEQASSVQRIRLSDKEQASASFTVKEGFGAPSMRYLFDGNLMITEAQTTAWSMNKGRGHNLADESTYMFVSHYIDIDTYYTDTSLSFLTDGASRSEAPKYYCKWITDDDRNAYDTYLGLHQVNSKANFLYEGFRSICSLNGDVNDIDKLRKTSDKVNDTLFGVAASYSSYDAFDSWGGIYTVTQKIFKKTAESPETRLSDLYTDFFEDEDILRGIDSDIKAAALQSSFAMAGALLLGFVTGGLIEGVAECALWSLCDFGEAVLTSEIDAALTLQLRYSYHVREPARMYDYYMDSI